MAVLNGVSSAQPRLRYFEELPAVLRFNRFIRSGYRAGYNYSQALFSIFELHNETGNIWSHLLPAIALMYGFFFDLEIKEWMYTVHALSALICLMASVAYHTCMACHHHYQGWIRIDVCGVYGLLLGTQLHIFTFAFPCHVVMLWVFTGLYIAVGVTGMRFSIRAKSPIARGFPMLALTVIRLSVLVMRPWFGSGNLHAWKLYALAEVLSLLGGMINALRFPERLVKPSVKKSAPQEVGQFDYWFNSHQIMHVLVVLAILAMRSGLKSDCQYLRIHPVVCQL